MFNTLVFDTKQTFYTLLRSNNSLFDSLEQFKVEVFFAPVEEGSVVDVDEPSRVTLAMDNV